MVSAGFRPMLVSLMLLGLCGVSFAQVAEIKGTVQRVDVPTGTIYLADGRIMRLEPGTRLYVGNREVSLADVQPGWVFATAGSTAAPDAVVVQPIVPPRALTPAAPAVETTGVDATGVVARVDPRTGTVTLQDGRVVRVASGTTVWEPIALGSVTPGASVFVRNAEPLDFRPGSTPAASRPLQMGTVASADASTSRVVLSDGTVVQLRPGAPVTFNGRSLAIADLRPGDEILVGVPAARSVAGTDSDISVLPRQAYGVVEAESIRVVRRTPGQ